MKTKTLNILAALGGACILSSCSTTYDAYGRPVQSVDPGSAAAAAAAAGVLGYAIGRNNDDDDRYRDRRYYRPSHTHHRQNRHRLRSW